MDSDPGNTLMLIILILVLTLVNAFFASAEMAIVSINKNKVKIAVEDGNKKAILLEKLIAEPTKFLSTIQVGITFAGLFSSAAAATGLSGDLGILLSQWGIPYGDQIALIIVTLILSYITLVFGELYPKRVALQHAEKVAYFSVKPILFILKLTAPFVKLLSISTNLLLTLSGIDKNGMDEKTTKEELRSLMEVGEENGVINTIEKDMINSIFEFDDKLAKEVMTPRTDVYAINVDTPIEKYIDELLSEKYSRIPVYQGNIDNIIGILYIKDYIVKARECGFESVDISGLLHKPYFIPERKNIDILFRELQSSKNHMAILIDEYGGFTGIVTMEDLIEEIMGEINDEYDDDNDITKIDANTYMINGSTTIIDLNEMLHLNLDENIEDYDTIAGLIIKILGYIPEDNIKKTIHYNNITLTIDSVLDNRIEKVKLTIEPTTCNKETAITA